MAGGRHHHHPVDERSGEEPVANGALEEDRRGGVHPTAAPDNEWGSAGWLLIVLALGLLLGSGTLPSLIGNLAAGRAGDRDRLAAVPLSAPVLGDGVTLDRDVALAAGLAPLAALDATQPGLPAVTTGEERSAAIALIDAMRTASEPPDEGYDRGLFGPPWSDATDRLFGGNGCSTRDDILARDLRDASRLTGSACAVAGGTFVDPYTGATVTFTRTDAAAVHIDHIYPLSVAWRMGAVRWDSATRLAFANDPLNLVAVAGHANEDKGALTPVDWLPTGGADRCAFAVRYAAVALRYDLPVTPADREVMVDQCR